MKLALSLAAAVLCLAATSPGRAQPKAEPRTEKTNADLEFNRARGFFDAWCEKLELGHKRDPRDLRTTLRLADCRRLNGQLDEARLLIEEAENQFGIAALSDAQRADDAQLGRAVPAGNPEQLWSQACEHFELSLRLEVSIAAQLAVAACHLRRGDLRAARALLATCIAALQPQAARDEFRSIQLRLARALTLEVERLQPRFIVKLPEDGGRIAINDRAARDNDIVRVDPGKHTVRATLRDGRVEQATVDLSPRATRLVTIGDGARFDRRRRLAFWGLAGGATAAAVTASLSLWAMEGASDDLTSAPLGRSCDRVGAFTLECDPGANTKSFAFRARLFQVTAIGATLLLGGAAAVYFTAPRSEQLRIAPTAGDKSIGLSATRAF
jgi:hypothetical protein